MITDRLKAEQQLVLIEDLWSLFDSNSITPDLVKSSIDDIKKVIKELKRTEFTDIITQLETKITLIEEGLPHYKQRLLTPNQVLILGISVVAPIAAFLFRYSYNS